MGDLKNEFSWSKSRHGKFEQCLRMYWYSYYGSWGGWNRDAPEEVREAYILNKLSTRQQWAGKVVHDIIRDVMFRVRTEGAQSVSEEGTIQLAHGIMRRQFGDSREGLYRRISPKRHPGLIEHEYAMPIPNGEWARNWENAKGALSNLFRMGWVERAGRIPRDRWLPIDELAAFPLEGVKVFAAPDFAFYEGDVLTIVDWKTGSPREGEDHQLQCYALFAASTWGAPLENIRARLVYLGSGEEREVGVSQDEIDAFMVHFRDSVGRMKALLANADDNQPLPKESFPMAQGRNECGFCPFRRLCLM